MRSAFAFRNDSEREHHAHYGRGNDEKDGVDLFQGGELHTYEDHHRQGDGGPVGVAGEGALRALGGAEEGDPGHLKHGGGDQGHRGRPKPVEHAVHHLGLAEFLQKPGDDKNDDDGGEDESQGGDHAPQDTAAGEARVGSHVDPHGTGGGFGDGDHVGKLAGGEPAGAFPQVGEEGDGGEAAAY